MAQGYAVFIYGDDWNGLYLNDELLYQGHDSISEVVKSIFDYLDIRYSGIDVTDFDGFESIGYPEKYKDFMKIYKKD